MSYRLFTFRDQSQRDIEMWENRDIDTETRIIGTRSIRKVLERYITEDSVLIEAGCGLGGWVKYFSLKGIDIVGVEYDERIVQKAKDFNPEINIIHSDVCRLGFSDNTFNGYISLGVIEHFQSGPQVALAEAKRILKPGGLLFISVPLLTPMRRTIAHPLRSVYSFLHVLAGRKQYFGEYRYTKAELLGFLKDFVFEADYIGVDDYLETDKTHHIGLYADYPFLRKTPGEIWELNTIGRVILKFCRLFSPWLYCSGVFVVARNIK